jgi:flagellar hook-associated protein 2
MDDVATLFTRVPQGSTNAQQIASGGIASRINNILNWSVSIGGGITERAGLERHVSQNDNVLSRRINAEDRRIETMIRNLQRREENYFRMFSRLESAMMQANSQMMFFEQMFWQG